MNFHFNLDIQFFYLLTGIIQLFFSPLSSPFFPKPASTVYLIFVPSFLHWQDGEVHLVLLDQMEDKDFLESPIYLVYLVMWVHLVLMEYQVMQHYHIFSGDV